VLSILEDLQQSPASFGDSNGSISLSAYTRNQLPQGAVVVFNAEQVAKSPNGVSPKELHHTK
jgi:hypothetical protein